MQLAVDVHAAGLRVKEASAVIRARLLMKALDLVLLFLKSRVVELRAELVFFDEEGDAVRMWKVYRV